MTDEKKVSTEQVGDTPPSGTAAELHDHRTRPEGVVAKQSQSYVIAGLAVLILLAALFSNNRARQTPKPSPAIPMSPSEANQRKIDELRQDLTEQQRKSEQSQKTAAASSGAGASTQSAGSQNTNTQSSATAEPPRDPIKDAERALVFQSRFASNLVSPAGDTRKSASERLTSEKFPAIRSDENPLRQQDAFALEAFRVDHSQPAVGQGKRSPEVNVNSATGQPYVLFEGTTLDTALVNRLDGEFSGPVKVMVTNPVYSQDRQHVLIPEGAFLLGDVQKVAGFGQKRLAVAFHRMLMPDGYSVDLDQFHGLDQAGETGLKDQVNNHYVQIFGTSIALGIIAGATQATTNGGYNQSGSDSYRQGVVSSVAHSSVNVLDHFINIPPTITIREGHRIKVYLTQDLLLPAYENHTVPPNI